VVDCRPLEAALCDGRSFFGIIEAKVSYDLSSHACCANDIWHLDEMIGMSPVEGGLPLICQSAGEKKGGNVLILRVLQHLVG